MAPLPSQEVVLSGSALHLHPSPPTSNALVASGPPVAMAGGIDGYTEGFRLRMTTLTEGSLQTHVSPS